MPASLVNSMSVESPYGFRSFNLLQGDITESRDEVLVASTHAFCGMPASGSVIDAIRVTHAIDFDRIEPIVLAGNTTGTYVVAPAALQPWRLILLVRMPGAELRVIDELVEVDMARADPLELYARSSWTLFGSLAALELRGDAYRSIALPLLGGQRGYPVRDAMSILLRQATEWLRVSRRMQVVNFYLFEEDHVAAWDTAMNDVLGRRYVAAAKDQVIRALGAEIVARIDASTGAREAAIREAVVPIERALRSDEVCLQQLAAFGRVLAERVVHRVCADVGLPWSGSLLGDIETVRKSGAVAPWMVSHLHSLRIFGNESIHARDAVSHRPASLGPDDLLAILASVMRLVAFLDDWCAQASDGG